MSKVSKTTRKAAQPKLSKTRKQTLRKKALATANAHALNPTWRPKAKSKKEKELRALRSHPRRERSTEPCRRVELGCRKLALKGSEYCARHHAALLGWLEA